MVRRIGSCLVVVCLATGLVPAVSAENPPSLEDFAFVVGSWHRTWNGGEHEEFWLPAKGGMMLGLYRKVNENGKAFFEYLRVEQREDGVYYVASPQGRPPTAFKLVEASEGRAVFENPEHDYPTRIGYELQPDGTLKGHIEGEVDGKRRSSVFRWQRADS